MADLMDLVNGCFELGGALALCLSVRRLWQDREIKGVHWAPTLYFFLWGAWNCLYYPSLGQWWSFAGGVAILAANCAWLGSLVWLTRPSARRRCGGSASRG